MINILKVIRDWVQEQDENDVGCLAHPDWDLISNITVETIKKESCFFGRHTMPPVCSKERASQRDGFNCGCFTSLNGSMLLSIERDNPSLWNQILTFDDFESKIVRPFWMLQINVSDRMLHFRYKVLRMMEVFYNQTFTLEQRHQTALAWTPLYGNGQPPSPTEGVFANWKLTYLDNPCDFEGYLQARLNDGNPLVLRNIKQPENLDTSDPLTEEIKTLSEKVYNDVLDGGRANRFREKYIKTLQQLMAEPKSKVAIREKGEGKGRLHGGS